MSNTLIATLGGLWALIFWGLGDWLVASSSKKSDSIEINAAFQLPDLVLLLPLILLTHQHINSWHNVFILSLAGLVFTGAFITFIKAFASGAVGIVSPLSATYPIFTLILTALFLTLNFSHLQILAMLIIVIGVLALAYEKRDKKISLHVQHYASGLAIFTAFLWGVGNVLQNSVISKESWLVVLGSIDASMLACGFLLLILKPADGLRRKTKRVLTNKRPLVAGTIYTFGSFGFYYSSVRVGSVLIPLIVSSASPLITSGLGAFVDKERLTMLKRAGAVTAVAGIIIINL